MAFNDRMSSFSHPGAAHALQAAFRRCDPDRCGAVPVAFAEAILAGCSPGMQPRQLRMALNNFRRSEHGNSNGNFGSNYGGNYNGNYNGNYFGDYNYHGINSKDDVVDYERLIDWLFNSNDASGMKHMGMSFDAFDCNNFSMCLPGLSDEDYPGFPVDLCPQQMPDLQWHSSCAANVLRMDYSIWQRYCNMRSRGGVSFARCIKPCMDVPNARIIGLVAGDDDCYMTFREVFQPVIASCHDEYRPGMQYPPPQFPNFMQNGMQYQGNNMQFQNGGMQYQNNAMMKYQNGGMNSGAPFGGRRFARVAARRNVRGFHFAPAMSREERRQVENTIINAARSCLTNEYSWQYYPLAGSRSWQQMPNGMSQMHEEELARMRLLFHEPMGADRLSAGIGRHWPDARGVILADNRRWAIWLNEEDHLHIICIEDGEDCEWILRNAAARLGEVLHAIERGLQQEGHCYARDEEFGYLTVCPSSVGNGFSVSMHMLLPCQAENGMQERAYSMGMRARPSQCDMMGMDMMYQSMMNGCMNGMNSMNYSMNGMSGRNSPRNNYSMNGMDNMRGMRNSMGGMNSPRDGYSMNGMDDMGGMRNSMGGMNSPRMNGMDNFNRMGSPMSRRNSPRNGYSMNGVDNMSCMHNGVTGTNSPRNGMNSPRSGMDGPGSGSGSPRMNSPRDGMGNYMNGMNNMGGMNDMGGMSNMGGMNDRSNYMNGMNNMGGMNGRSNYMSGMNNMNRMNRMNGMNGMNGMSGRYNMCDMFDMNDCMAFELAGAASANFGRSEAEIVEAFAQGCNQLIMQAASAFPSCSLWSSSRSGDMQQLPIRPPSGGPSSPPFRRPRSAHMGCLPSNGQQWNRNMQQWNRNGMGDGMGRMGNMSGCFDAGQWQSNEYGPMNMSFCDNRVFSSWPSMYRPSMDGWSNQYCSQNDRYSYSWSKNSMCNNGGNSMYRNGYNNMCRNGGNMMGGTGNMMGGNGNGMKYGNGNDMMMRNNGSNNMMYDGSDNNNMKYGNGKDMMMRNNGSNNMMYDGSNNNNNMKYGNGKDMMMYNNGSNNMMYDGSNNNNNMKYGNGNDMTMRNNGSNNMMYDGSNNNMKYGNGKDMMMYNNGSNMMYDSSNMMLNSDNSSLPQFGGNQWSGEHMSGPMFPSANKSRGGSFLPPIGKQGSMDMSNMGRSRSQWQTQQSRSRSASPQQCSATGQPWSSNRFDDSSSNWQSMNRQSSNRFDDSGSNWQSMNRQSSNRFDDSSSNWQSMNRNSMNSPHMSPMRQGGRQFQYGSGGCGQDSQFGQGQQRFMNCGFGEDIMNPPYYMYDEMRREPYFCAPHGLSMITNCNGISAINGSMSKYGNDLDGGSNFGNNVFAMLPGLGDTEYPGFPNAGSQQLPCLDNHRNICCEILRRDPSMYNMMFDRRTKAGTAFHYCIRAGVIDPSCTGVGAVACDEDCYDTFSEFFDQVLRKCHGDEAFMAAQRQAGNGSGNANDMMTMQPMRGNGNDVVSMRCTMPVRPWHKDMASKYIVSCTVVCRRNVRGHRFPPVCGRGERVNLERLLVESMRKAQFECPELRGSYFPLKNSQTWSARPEGMTANEEAELARECLLFREPQDTAHLASGVGRHWPEARGVYAADSRRLAVFINEDDHMCLMSNDNAGDFNTAYTRAWEAMSCMESGLQEQGEMWARDRRLGYLTTSPMDVGTGMQAYVTMRLPMLQNYNNGGIEAFCERLGLRCGPAGPPGTWKIWSCRGSLGQNPMQVMNFLVMQCEELANAEVMLEQGGQPQMPQPCDHNQGGGGFAMSGMGGMNGNWNRRNGDWNGRSNSGYRGNGMDMNYSGNDFNSRFNRFSGGNGGDFGNNFNGQGGNWSNRGGFNGDYNFNGRGGMNGQGMPRSRPWSANRDQIDRNNSNMMRFQERMSERFNGMRSGFELREIVKSDMQRWQAATGDALKGNARVLLKQASPQLGDDEVNFVLELAAEYGGVGCEASDCDCNVLFAWIYDELD